MASHFRTSDSADGATGRPQVRARLDYEPQGRAASGADAANEEPLVPVGRHARRTPRPAHGTSASVTGAFQRLDPSVTGSFAAISPADLQPIAAPAAASGSAPRPVSDDPAVTGSFARIGSKQAAHAVTRDNAAAAAGAARARAEGGRMRAVVPPRPPRPRLSRRAIAAIALAAAVVVVIGGWLLYRALSSAVVAGVVASEHGEQAGPDGSLEVAGTIYALAQQDDGVYVLTVRPADVAAGDGGSVGAGDAGDGAGAGAGDAAGDAVAGGAVDGAAGDSGAAAVGDGIPAGATVVCTLPGTPAQLIAYNGSIVMPESYPDGTWDVMAYTPGGEAGAVQVVGSDGEPVHGTGAVVSATVDGTNLVIVDSVGQTTTVSLV